jgi:hypothetical protein
MSYLSKEQLSDYQEQVYLREINASPALLFTSRKQVEAFISVFEPKGDGLFTNLLEYVSDEYGGDEKEFLRYFNCHFQGYIDYPEEVEA